MALMLGGVSHAATVYNLDSPPGCASCSQSGGVGTVTVTASGNDLNVSISLKSGVWFNPNGNGFDSIAFSIVGDPTVSITNISNGNFTAIANPSPFVDGWDHMDGSGYWDNALAYNGSAGTDNAVSFTIHTTGGTPLVLDNSDDNKGANGGLNNFMAVDIYNTNVAGGATGVVSAIGTSTGVPEPGIWAMMIAGIGLIGAAMRRRAQSLLTFA
jgi:hypothetical protein